MVDEIQFEGNDERKAECTKRYDQFVDVAGIALPSKIKWRTHYRENADGTREAQFYQRIRYEAVEAIEEAQFPQRLPYPEQASNKVIMH